MNRIDSVISHGMGKLKAARARLRGLTGVFRTIAEQHGEVAALLQRARTSDEKLAELWPDIRRELLSHEKAELRIVFPELRKHEGLRAMADHHETEAEALERLIESIGQMPAGSADRRTAFKRLVDMVLAHADEEETQIFPKAQEQLGRAEVDALEPRFVAAKLQVANAV